MVEPFTYDRYLGTVDKYKVIDLYPYKIKDINNFIHRDHIPYREGDKESRDYAVETRRRGVEGLWVNDNDTWVWMPPKLFFYGNLGTIETGEEGSKSRDPKYPTIRDNEWIAFSYILCCDGFSGFENDPDFTCNTQIRDIENGVEVPEVYRKHLNKTCIRKDGTWKKYVEAWDYLTWFYHHVNPRQFPLGKALYENYSYNLGWIASRKWGKTLILAAGDASQELWTNGVTDFSKLTGKSRVNMFMGASDSKYVNSFMNAMELSFTNVPGIQFAPHGYFTQTTTNDWDEKRGAVVKTVRQTDGSFIGTGSQIGKAVIQKNNAEVVVSTRSKRIYVDEAGLVENMKAVFNAADATLKSPDGKFGILAISGTGGVIEKIAETKYIFQNPIEFDIYSIPNYWTDNSLIGLFGPASYTLSVFKDKDGNTDLIAATKAIIADREKFSQGDKSKQTARRMNEPLDPSEPFLSGKSDYFDKDVIIDRIEILNHGEFEKKGKVYTLELGKPVGENDYDVIATPKEGGWHNIIKEYHDKKGREGGIVIFEPPMGDGREFLDYNNLYKVVCDPKTDLGTGESDLVIKVWKGFPQRALKEGEMFDNIVATAQLRDGNLMPFLLLCLWYKAKGQYERNVSGIPDFFHKWNLRGLLQPTPLSYIKDITPSTKQVQSSGIFLTPQLKREALMTFKTRHKATVHIDYIGRRFKHVETWYDLALLSEMNFYDDKGNFDNVSAMLILMLWLEAEYIPTDSRLNQENLDEASGWEELFTTAKRILA